MHDRTSIELVMLSLLIDAVWAAAIASGAMYFIPIEDNKKKVVAFGALFLVSWFAVRVAIRWGL
jgi:hypothetical protein